MDLNKILMSFMSKIEKDKKDYHDRVLVNIPDIIDTKVDKKLWDNIYEVLYLYLEMVQDYIILEDEMDLYVDDWVFYFDKIRLICDDANKLMLVSIYIHSVYENLLEWCVQNEYYEGASNLKKFNELL
jgi:hypothetical protein